MNKMNAFENPCAEDVATDPTQEPEGSQLEEMTNNVSGGVTPMSCPNYDENDDVANSMAEGYF